MESDEMPSDSDATVSISASHEDVDVVTILGEIMGATNLKAALRSGSEERGSDTPSPRDSVNAFCDVYWGNDLIHRTKKISKK